MIDQVQGVLAIPVVKANRSIGISHDIAVVSACPIDGDGVLLDEKEIVSGSSCGEIDSSHDLARSAIRYEGGSKIGNGERDAFASQNGIETRIKGTFTDPQGAPILIEHGDDTCPIAGRVHSRGWSLR